MRSPDRPVFRQWAAVAALLFAAMGARAQEIEPRAYSNAPVGVNFFIAGVVRTQGGLTFDAVPLADARLRTTSAVFAYARTLQMWGKSGKFDVIVPYTSLEGSALYRGEPIRRDVAGVGRSAFRVSINLHGAPALSLREFRDWKQDVIVGVSLQASPPWAQYDEDRVVNLGSNRWSFKPEIGVSKAVGAWTLEAQAAVLFFTDNDDFFNGNTRSQDPLYSLQGHVIHGFRNGTWLSVDATWFAAGRTQVNGVLNNDLQQNWRVGATLSIPLDRANSIKFAASSGVSARTGNNFDAIGVAWQHRWGAGL